MGGAASKGLAEAVSTASKDDLKAALDCVSEADRVKLSEALGKNGGKVSPGKPATWTVASAKPFDGLWRRQASMAEQSGGFVLIIGTTLLQGSYEDAVDCVCQVSSTEITSELEEGKKVSGVADGNVIKWCNGDVFWRELDFGSVASALSFPLDKTSVSLPVPRGHVFLMSTPTTSVIVKARPISAALEDAAQKAAADAKVAPAQVARGKLLHSEQGLWTAEPWYELGHLSCDDNDEECAVVGLASARLHKGADIAWFVEGGFKARLTEAFPFLSEEPDNSGLFNMISHPSSAGAKERFAGLQDELRALMRALPRPLGEHAERLVIVHGDLWAHNICKTKSGDFVVIDFEQASVCSAAQDMVHVHGRIFAKAYLREMLSRDPSDEEVDAVALEGVVASHVHHAIFRPLFWRGQGWWERDDSWVGDAKEFFVGASPKAALDQLVEDGQRLSSLVSKLRKDSGARKKLLDLADRDLNGEEDARIRESGVDFLEKLEACF